VGNDVGLMSLISEILEHNRRFVRDREYEAFRTDRFPNKKLVVIACMDTRLVELLPKAMNVRNGDVKMIKVAGALVSHPFGSVMRSILIAVYQLDAQEIVVIGHHGCGMANLDGAEILTKAQKAGVSPEVLHTLDHAGIDLGRWLTGFEKVEDGVRSSVDMIRHHPLLPNNLAVHGMMMDSETGALELIIDGYNPVD
jgi:carbonic anhydrase